MQIDNRLDRTLSHVNLKILIKQHRDDSWWNWHILMAARRKVHLPIKYLLLYLVPSNGIRTKVILFLGRIYVLHLCGLQYNRSHKIRIRKHKNITSGCGRHWGNWLKNNDK